MPQEPPLREAGDFLQGPRLGEEVGGPGDDDQLLRATQHGQGLPVQLEDLLVAAPDDQPPGRAGRRGRRPPRPPRIAGPRPPARAAATSAAAAPVLPPK